MTIPLKAIFTGLDVSALGEFETGDVVGAEYLPAATGWAAPSGTLDRTSLAAYAGQTISNPPTQAEVQALDDACKKVSQVLAALITDLTTKGYLTV